MVGRELRTICPIGEDHPGLLQGKREVFGGMSSSPEEGGFLIWATRATMGTAVPIPILLVSNLDQLPALAMESLQVTICCLLVTTWVMRGTGGGLRVCHMDGRTERWKTISTTKILYRDRRAMMHWYNRPRRS